MLIYSVIFLILFIENVVPKSINDVVDEVLGSTGLKISQDGGDVQKLALNFSRAFPYSFLWGRVTLTPRIDCGQAWFGNLSTLHRTEDAKLISLKRTLSLEVGLGLSQLRFGFESCTLKLEPLPFLKIATGLSATAGENSLGLTVSFRLEGGACRARLERLELLKAKHLTVQTGNSLLGLMKDKILTFLVNYFHLYFVELASNELKNYLKQIVEDKKFCEGSTLLLS